MISLISSKWSVWLSLWLIPLIAFSMLMIQQSWVQEEIYSSSNAIFFHMHSCLRFADLDADGDYHLLCGTLEKSLKIYRGVLTRGWQIAFVTNSHLSLTPRRHVCSVKTRSAGHTSVGCVPVYRRTFADSFCGSRIRALCFYIPVRLLKNN